MYYTYTHTHIFPQVTRIFYLLLFLIQIAYKTYTPILNKRTERQNNQ